MSPKELQELLDQYIMGTISHSDFQRLWNTLKQEELEGEWHEFIEQMWSNENLHPIVDPKKKEVLLQLKGLIAKETNATGKLATLPSSDNKWRWWAVAAVFTMVLLGSFWWKADKTQPLETPQVATKPIDVDPGKEGAILTLADGSKVVLDSLGNGVIANQNGAMAIIKNGELLYDVIDQTSDEVVYNTMSTPKGRQYSLVLSDGTKVWLNAASSLRYPTSFRGNERKVEVSGEVYFEVAKNKKMPFRVLVQDREEIEVLGTRFNVSAYLNEPTINTTLLEGSISLLLTNQQASTSVPVSNVLLKPGQQAQLSNKDIPDLKIENNPDIAQVMAWKNGQFNFEGMTLKQVMKQLERWYDITVRYDKGIEDIQFGGSISRQISLGLLLKELEFMGIHFRMEGDRQLVILPY